MRTDAKVSAFLQVNKSVTSYITKLQIVTIGYKKSVLEVDALSKKNSIIEFSSLYYVFYLS